MTAKLHHRGPDGRCVQSLGPVCFGHTRLAIIDLSAAGAQPMYDLAKARLVTFNGEIYNHLELRDELSRLGSDFSSLSDTEVILEGYRHWGLECLSRFNGMFAFALWDEPSQTFILARDRLGKKPLYFWSQGEALSFASELPALLADGRISDEINERAIIQFLSLGYLSTSECINPHVRRLPPGHVLVWRRGEAPRVVSYWNLAAQFAKKDIYSGINEAAERLQELFRDAVKIRLMSDVPLGAFLSGGIDSSSVVAQMCRLQSPASCQTFSVGFRETTFNELDNAQVVSKHLGVSHRQEFLRDDLVSALGEVSEFVGEPFADTSVLPTYYLSAFARRYVTVALSGDGADELFGGYETYVADKLHRYVQCVPKSLARAAEKFYRMLIPRDFGKVSRDYKILQFLRGCSLPYAAAHFSWRELFSREELRQMVVPSLRASVEDAHPLKEFVKFESDVADAHYLDKSMYIDVKTWLVDDILVKVDRASMAHGLEVRSPFLDYRLVEFAAKLPPEFKLRGFSKKHILKVAQERELPRATIRQPKQGFNSPISQWLFTSLAPLCAEMVDDSPILRYVKRESVQAVVDEHVAHKQDNSFKLFAMIQLHVFLSMREKGVSRQAA